MPCSARFGQKAEAGAREKAWSTAFIVFSSGKARQARGNNLGLDNVSVNGLWAMGMFSSCLVPGSG